MIGSIFRPSDASSHAGHLRRTNIMDEIDIWRTAKILIDNHGDDASIEAAMRADRALDDGLPEAVSIWVRVRDAIDDLKRLKPRDGEAVN